MTSNEAAIVIGILIVTYTVLLLIMFCLWDIRRALRNGWVISAYTPNPNDMSARRQITPKDPA